MFVDILQIILIIFACVLTLHSLFNIYLTLYAWEDPLRIQAAKAPKLFKRPEHGFTVLLPSRHEELVIGETLRKLSQANYPSDMFELLVLCTPDDTKTISAAQKAIHAHKIPNAEVIVFNPPAGKSRGMNIGVGQAKHDLITIFDAEDDVSPEIFNIANTLYQDRGIDILQCGVQLMDFQKKWFSAHNVLEYFFWFKSRMHFYARMGIVPLGGNTVFFRADDIRSVEGWDEHGLTEDADIGIRLSLQGKKFGVMYDSKHVTKEETPDSIAAFIKQRTRWNQGFLQILNKKEWKQLASIKQILLLLYVLCGPTFMGLVFLLAPLILVFGYVVKVNVMLSLFTFLPLFLSLMTIIIGLVGLHEFGKEQKLRVRIIDYARLVVSFVPYQIILSVAAARSIIRALRSENSWEKTKHVGAHRSVHNQPGNKTYTTETYTDQSHTTTPTPGEIAL